MYYSQAHDSRASGISIGQAVRSVKRRRNTSQNGMKLSVSMIVVRPLEVSQRKDRGLIRRHKRTCGAQWHGGCVSTENNIKINMSSPIPIALRRFPRH